MILNRFEGKPPMKLKGTQCLRLAMFGIGLLQLISRAESAVVPESRTSEQHGAELYRAKCNVCHGPNLKGVAPVFPSLIDISKRLSDEDIKKQIRNGKGRMLAFPHLSDDDLNSLVMFLKAPDSATKPFSWMPFQQRPCLQTHPGRLNGRDQTGHCAKLEAQSDESSQGMAGDRESKDAAGG